LFGFEQVYGLFLFRSVLLFPLSALPKEAVDLSASAANLWALVDLWYQISYCVGCDFKFLSFILLLPSPPHKPGFHQFHLL